MQGLLIGLVIIVAVASRPIEVRIWRAGHLPDRAAAAMLVGRMPVIVLLASLIQGYALWFTLLFTAMALAVPVLFYQYVLNLLRESRAERLSGTNRPNP